MNFDITTNPLPLSLTVSTDDTPAIALAVVAPAQPSISLAVQAGAPANIGPVLDAINAIKATDLQPVLDKLDTLAAPDLSPVLDAIDAIPTTDVASAVAPLATLASLSDAHASLIAAIAAIPAVDLAPVLAAVAAIPTTDVVAALATFGTAKTGAVTAAQAAIIARIDSIPAVNLQPVLDAIHAIPTTDVAAALAAYAAAKPADIVAALQAYAPAKAADITAAVAPLAKTADLSALPSTARIDALESTLKAAVGMLFAKGEVRPFTASLPLPFGWEQVAGDPPPAALPSGIGLQGNSTTLANVHYGGSACMLSDGLHLIASTGANHTKVVNELQLSTITRAAPPAVANTGLVAGVLPSGKMLLVGGISSAATTTARLEAYIYDPAANTWTRVADMPASGLQYGVAHLLPGGQLAVLPNQTLNAGAWGNPTVLYLYNETTNTWTTVAHGGYQMGSAAIVTPSYSGANTCLMGDGRIAMLEYAASGTTTGFFALNPLTGAWTNLGPRPAGYQNTLGWLATHPDGLQVHASTAVYIYSTANSTWSTVALAIGGQYSYNPVNAGSFYGWRNVKLLNGMYLQVLSTNNGGAAAWRYTCLGYTPSGTVYAKNNNTL